MRVLALRHDPLKPHLAGVRKHEWAILVVEVLVEAQPRCRTPEQARERRLAHCERVAPQIVAVEFDQVEGIEEHARVVTPIPDAVEGRDPVIATCHRFAVDDAGARAQLGDCLDNEREAVPRSPSLRAITRKPSCLISCSHASPEGGCGALVGRQGAMKPAGRARGRESMV